MDGRGGSQGGRPCSPIADPSHCIDCIDALDVDSENLFSTSFKHVINEEDEYSHGKFLSANLSSNTKEKGGKARKKRAEDRKREETEESREEADEAVEAEMGTEERRDG